MGFRSGASVGGENQMGTIDEIPIDDRLISYREVTKRVMEYPKMRANLEEASVEINYLRKMLVEAEGKAKEAEDKNFALTTQYSKVVNENGKLKRQLDAAEFSDDVKNLQHIKRSQAKVVSDLEDKFADLSINVRGTCVIASIVYLLCV